MIAKTVTIKLFPKTGIENQCGDSLGKIKVPAERNLSMSEQFMLNAIGKLIQVPHDQMFDFHFIIFSYTIGLS